MPVEEELLASNRLLAAVEPPLRGRLAELGEPHPLEFQQTLFEQGAPIERVTFPFVGVCSLVSVMDDDRVVEVATVGNEGFVGLPVFLQATLTSAHRAFVQIRGEGISFSAASFLDLSNAGGPLQIVPQR